MAGDPAFAPVFEELNRRNAVVFFHPATASCCRNLIPGLQISGIIEYDLDTARAAESLLVNGTPAKFPNIRFIFSHSGGALTVLGARIVDDYPKNRMDLLPHGVEYELKKFYYEVAHATKAPALDAMKDLVPVSQILFGSDVPIRAYELTDGRAGPLRRVHSARSARHQSRECRKAVSAPGVKPLTARFKKVYLCFQQVPPAGANQGSTIVNTGIKRSPKRVAGGRCTIWR